MYLNCVSIVPLVNIEKRLVSLRRSKRVLDSTELVTEILEFYVSYK